MKVRIFSLFVLVAGLALVLTWAVTAQEPSSDNGGLEHTFPRGVDADRRPSPRLLASFGDPEAQSASAAVALNLNLGQEPPTLDPALATDTTSSSVIEQLFIGLVDLDDETAEVKPELATSWTISPDGTVYTFTLRSDVMWSDGNPVTAGDVRYGILRTLDPATAADYAYVLGLVIKNAAAYNQGTITNPNQVGVTTVGTTTLRVTLEEPGTYALSILSMWIARPMPQWAIEAHGVPTWTEPANIVTNGPYQLTEWVHDDHILLEKNPTYYNAANVQIERVKMWMEDEATALATYETGELDTTNVPLSDLDRVKTDPLLSQELYIAPTGCSYYYGFNTSKPPVDNVHMRRALSHAVNRWGVVNDVTKGGQEPAQWFCRPGMVGCPTMDSHPNAGIKSDSNAAKAELQAYMDEMGYTSVGEIPEMILMHNTSESHRRIAEYIRQNWIDNLGITVTISDTNWSDYRNLLRTDSPQVWRQGWCLDYPDANNWTKEVFAPGGHHQAYTSWTNEEFEAILEEAALEPDPVKRQDMYAQAEQILVYQDAAIIPIYWYTNVGVTRPYLERTYPAGAFDIGTWRITRVSDVIGTDGGDLTSYDGNTTVQIPAGAITYTIIITHTPASGMPPGGNLTGIGHVFDVTAVYSDTGQSAQIASGHACTITVQYNDTEKGPAIEDTLGLYWWDEGAGQWSQQGIITSPVNTTDNLVTAQVDRFSLFAVLGETHRVYLPLVLRNP
jgi:oligopeptide transport system substrate-binding protein